MHHRYREQFQNILLAHFNAKLKLTCSLNFWGVQCLRGTSLGTHGPLIRRLCVKTFCINAPEWYYKVYPWFLNLEIENLQYFNLWFDKEPWNYLNRPKIDVISIGNFREHSVVGLKYEANRRRFSSYHIGGVFPKYDGKTRGVPNVHGWPILKSCWMTSSIDDVY